MSYEPTLVILKKDLDKHEELIVNGGWQYDNSDESTRGGELGMTVMEYIQNVYTKYKPLKIGGIEIIICQPSLTSYNKSIRDKLTELNVEFGEDW